ncbi:MAG: DNA polymerase IV [Patescibacteria group bacterium]
MSQRIIFHIDLDAFFASCEVLKNSKLAGKAVVVGADPKEGRGRGVVSTASYEARKFGVHSAQPISIAWRLAGGRVIFLLPDFAFYEKMSAKVMKILQKYVDAFESWGIDEAYLDVSEKIHNFREAKEFAQKIKEEIKEKTKLTCSIGIGPNKLLAKIASGYKKPDGLVCILPDKVLEFLKPLSCRELIGVGPKSEEKLARLGVKTISDLQKISREKLVDIFGKFGSSLYDYSRGIDESEVKESKERKSISCEHTFEKDTQNPYLIFATLNKLAQEVFKLIRKEKYHFGQVAIKVRYENFETHTRQSVLSESSSKFYDIKTKVRELILPFLKKGRSIRLVGVKVGRLRESKN